LDGGGVKITIAGAGFYGSTLAQRVAEGGYAEEVVLTDIVEGKPQGLALDLMQSRPLAGFETRLVGTNGYDETAGSDICVVTAGVPRKPGMSRMDLLETNARIVADVTRKLVAASPGTVLIVVSNPLDEMTALAAAVSGLPKQRVMGQAGLLDSARMRHFVAERAGVPAREVEAMTLGSHGDTMVPVPSRATVGGRPLTEVLDAGVIDEIVQRTRDGGAEIVALLRTGSAYFAPAAAAETMVRAVAGDTNEVHPVSAWVDGPYGIPGVYVGVPARLGRGGVAEVVELELAGEELAALRTAAAAVGAKQAEVLGLLA
jgi:malate dehydrogenase